MSETVDECILDEARFFDADTRRWGYAVICCNSRHGNQQCPAEREIFVDTELGRNQALPLASSVELSATTPKPTATAEAEAEL